MTDATSLGWPMRRSAMRVDRARLRLLWRQPQPLGGGACHIGIDEARRDGVGCNAKWPNSMARVRVSPWMPAFAAE